MKYNVLTTPCADCPFLKSEAHAFSIERLTEFASGAFHCHKTGEWDDETGQAYATSDSLACAGALIFMEKRGETSNIMRVMERLGVYDRGKLDMTAKVR